MGVMSEEADLSRITVQRSGEACIRGSSITVADVLHWLASGMTENEILHAYPNLVTADFAAVYAYASQAPRKRTLN